MTEKDLFNAQQLHRGEYQEVNYVNFKKFFHQMLNISHVLASCHMYSMDYSDCALKCLLNMSCFSFNFATLPDNNSGQYLCELLASDKYNHTNSFVPSRDFDHFAITSPCESLPCQNGGTCRPLYDTNSYVCQCAKGNNGTFCENGMNMAFRLFLILKNRGPSRAAVINKMAEGNRMAKGKCRPSVLWGEE
ncbi:uncharacterized protein [Montipora capricornis]|uniref:uncharacterized protein n=1 Tax=Montipora capricornis TaxID=246305 RepID=UPI0035F1DA90